VAWGSSSIPGRWVFLTTSLSILTLFGPWQKVETFLLLPTPHRKKSLFQMHQQPIMPFIQNKIFYRFAGNFLSALLFVTTGFAGLLTRLGCPPRAMTIRQHFLGPNPVGHLRLPSRKLRLEAPSPA